ncbi:MAG: RNA polymerase sigma-70 factor (ECF subfamily) [Roseivirga sp.]|jgi:RNA polymerase sigma-70 factor (ECF subfamily)
MERKAEHIFDELLIIRCQDNDEVALKLLWKRWQPKLLKWSFDFIKDSDDAQEIAQESWMSIFSNLNKLKDPSLFRFWAYKIVQRRAADWIRKAQRDRKGLEEIKLTYTEVDAPDTKEDQVSGMLLAIHALADHHQQILRLFYLEKTPIKVIAHLLDKPEGTIKSSLFYAREQLKKQLKLNNHEKV